MSSMPLSVEYAKSGKSGCQGCRNKIPKGELRAGFVGKSNFGATAWYHYDCIWTDYKNLKSIDSAKSLKSIVEGYDNLKDEDQNKLERDLPKYCKEAVAKATEQAAGPKPQMAAEYAKSAKSSCKGCSKNIGKNVLRLGFPGKANFGATAWYHYECIWTDFENLKSIDTSKSLKSIIDGYSELKEEDKNNLERDVPKYCKDVVGKVSEQAAGPKPQLAAEYAKSAKSSCKRCSKTIDKGLLRLGFPGKANFGATAWYHYDCIWDDRENLKSVDQAKSVKSNVDGYSKLNEEDQKKLERDLTKSSKRKSETAEGLSSPAKKAK